MDSILIIDDEPQIRKLLSRMMELEGYEVFQAADCQSTLKQLKLHNPQVVLCDVFLPDGNGVDMVTTIKKLYPEIGGDTFVPPTVHSGWCAGNQEWSLRLYHERG